MSAINKTERSDYTSVCVGLIIECETKKYIASTTVVATLAIAAAVVGILAIIASLQSVSGLGAISQIGWQAGAALITVGTTTLIALIIITLVRYCHSSTKKKEKESRNVNNDATLLQQLEKDKVYSTTKNHVIKTTQTSFQRSIDNQSAKEQKVADEEFRVPSLETILKELKISDLDQYLQGIYGNDTIPFPPLPNNKNSTSCKIYEKLVRLILLSHEEFFSLNLDEIAGFSFKELSVVNQRLLLSEKRLWPIPPTALAPPGEHLTLGNLRSLNVEQIFAARIPENCLGLLSAVQLENIFTVGKNLTSEFVQLLLPENEYTYRRLRIFDCKILASHFKQMKITFFRYLPIECFELPTFPWNMITSSAENFKTLFSLSRSKTRFFDEYDNEFTQNVLGKIHLLVIKRLAPLLSFDHLLFIPEEKLKDKDFPWLDFVNREDAGSKIHCLSSTLLLETHIPWEAFANKKDELDNLLKTCRTKSGNQEWYDDFTRNILRRVSIKIIQTFAPLLSFDHLLFIPEEKLKDKDFPWLDFVNREDAGSKIHCLSSTLLLETHIPWEAFANKKDELNNLLKTCRTKSGNQEWNDDFTRNILGKLGDGVIQKFAPNLQLGHLPFFGSKLKEQTFPWDLFIKKEGAASFLHTHSEDIGLDVFASQYFPWQSFSKTEISLILPTSYNTHRTAKILNAIHEDTLKTLLTSDLLDKELRKLLNPTKQKILI